MPIIFKRNVTGRIENTNNVKIIEPISAVDMTALAKQIVEIDHANLVRMQRTRVEHAMAKLARELAALDELEPQYDVADNGERVGHTAIVSSADRAAVFNSSKVHWTHGGIRATRLGGQHGVAPYIQWYSED